MRFAVVTGANGFIGRNLIRKLLENKDIEIYALTSNDKIISCDKDSRVHMIHCDLEQSLMPVALQLPHGIDVLYHFAWNGVRLEMRDNLEEQMKNINIAMNVMLLAKEIGIQRIIFPGSTNEYLYNDRPIDSKALPTPIDAYGSVKIAVRYLCREFALKNNIEFIYVIIASTYAADRQDNNVIYYTIKSLLKKEKPILTKLEQKWDYVHIDDVVEALFIIGNKGKNDAVYAIGHGDNWPLLEYIKIIHKIIDSSLPLGVGEIPYKDNRIPNSCINIEPLKYDTGFYPKVDFCVGIAEVIRKIRCKIS